MMEEIQSVWFSCTFIVNRVVSVPQGIKILAFQVHTNSLLTELLHFLRFSLRNGWAMAAASTFTHMSGFHCHYAIHCWLIVELLL